MEECKRLKQPFLFYGLLDKCVLQTQWQPSNGWFVMQHTYICRPNICPCILSFESFRLPLSFPICWLYKTFCPTSNAMVYIHLRYSNRMASDIRQQLSIDICGNFYVQLKSYCCCCCCCCCWCNWRPIPLINSFQLAPLNVVCSFNRLNPLIRTVSNRSFDQSVTKR